VEVFLAGDSSKGLAARCVDVGWLVIRPGVEDSSKGPKSAEVQPMCSNGTGESVMSSSVAASRF
jgi:hypothetical protein